MKKKRKYKVIDQLQVDNYKLLELDRGIEDVDYDGFLIDGEYFESVPVYDMPDNIGVRSSKNFLNKDVECVRMR